MNDDWAERLRKHLENYEVEPPPGLWEAICERLGIDPEPAPEPVPAKKPAQMKRWIWAAAAGILALVGVFVAYQWENDEAVAEAEKVSRACIVTYPRGISRKGNTFLSDVGCSDS
jgi:hypothetical protein